MHIYNIFTPWHTVTRIVLHELIILRVLLQFVTFPTLLFHHIQFTLHKALLKTISLFSFVHFLCERFFLVLTTLFWSLNDNVRKHSNACTCDLCYRLFLSSNKWICIYLLIIMTWNKEFHNTFVDLFVGENCNTFLVKERFFQVRNKLYTLYLSILLFQI